MVDLAIATKESFTPAQVGEYKGLNNVVLPVFSTQIQKGKNAGAIYNSLVKQVKSGNGFNESIDLDLVLKAFPKEDIESEIIIPFFKTLGTVASREAQSAANGNEDKYKEVWDKWITSLSTTGESSRGLDGQIKAAMEELATYAIQDGEEEKNADGSLKYPDAHANFKAKAMEVKALRERKAKADAEKEAEAELKVKAEELAKLKLADAGLKQ